MPSSHQSPGERARQSQARQRTRAGGVRSHAAQPAAFMAPTTRFYRTEGSAAVTVYRTGRRYALHRAAG
jgi:hypothetical protein